MITRASDPRVIRTRAKVLATARELLQEGGIAAVTIDNVVSHSRVAKTTIYRHWASRSDLVVELLTSLVPAVPQVDTAGTLEDQLTTFLVVYGRQLEDGAWAAALPALIAAADRDSEIARVRRLVLAESQKPFVELLDAYASELKPVDTRDAAAQLFGPLLHRRLIDTGPIDRVLIDHAVGAFLARFGAQPSDVEPVEDQRSSV